MLSTSINKISRSKEVLIYTGVDLRIELSAMCLYRVYRELDTLLSTLILSITKPILSILLQLKINFPISFVLNVCFMKMNATKLLHGITKLF